MAAPEYAFLVCRETDAAVRELARFVHDATSLEPSFLFESLQADALINRYAEPSDPCSVVIALLTSDDGPRTGTDAPNRPTSPEVVFSLGYFFARLPERNILVLSSGGHVPSQLKGVVQISIGDSDWLHQLGRELGALGAVVDFSKI